MTLQQIKDAALKLEPAQRELLAEELLRSVTNEERDAIDQAWLEEVRHRDGAFASGATGAKPVQQVIDRLMKKANP